MKAFELTSSGGAKTKPSYMSSVVDLSQVPPDLAAALKKLDKDGNGVSVEEVEQAAAISMRQQGFPMASL